jgi:Na+/proline symporter
MKLECIKKEGNQLKEEMQDKLKGYVVAAFGLVAGLAWNEAIKSLIEYFFPLNKNTILAKFIYAILITFVLVFVTVYISRLLTKKEKEEEKKQNIVT